MSVVAEPDREILEAWLEEHTRDAIDAALDQALADLSPEEQAAAAEFCDTPDPFEVRDLILEWHEETLRRLYALEQAWLAQPPGDPDDPEVRRRVIWEVLRHLHPDEDLGEPPADAEAIPSSWLRIEYNHVAQRFDGACLPYGNPFVEAIEGALEQLAFDAAGATAEGWRRTLGEE